MNGTISLLPLRVNSRHTNSIIAHVNVPFLILNLENSKSFVVSGAPWVYLFSVLSMMFAFLVWCIEGNLNGLFSLRNLNCWTVAINPWKSFLGSLGFFYYCLKASCCPIFAATTMWHSSDFLEVSVPAKNMVDKECWLFFSIVLCLSATDPARPLDMILHPSFFIFHDWAHLLQDKTGSFP